MTPHERASFVCGYIEYHPQMTQLQKTNAIADAIQGAIKAEREECAKVAESWRRSGTTNHDLLEGTGYEIAELILEIMRYRDHKEGN